jgi:hypothetical protein
MKAPLAIFSFRERFCGVLFLFLSFVRRSGNSRAWEASKGGLDHEHWTRLSFGLHRSSGPQGAYDSNQITSNDVPLALWVSLNNSNLLGEGGSASRSRVLEDVLGFLLGFVLQMLSPGCF